MSSSAESRKNSMILPYAFMHLQLISGDIKLQAKYRATHNEGQYDEFGFSPNFDTQIKVEKKKKQYRSQSHIDYELTLRDEKSSVRLCISVKYLPSYRSGQGSVIGCSYWVGTRRLMTIDKCIAIFEGDSIELYFYRNEWPSTNPYETENKNDAYNRFLKNDKEILKTLRNLKLDAVRI